SWGTQLSTEAPHSLAYTSLRRKTATTNGFFPCATTAWGSPLNTLKGFLSFSSGCTGETSSRAPGSDWLFARKSWSGWAAESGSSHNPKKAQSSILPCQKRVGTDEND